MEMLPGSASPVLSLMPQSQFIWRREEGKKTDKDNFQHPTTITSWKGEHRVVLAGVRFTLPGFTEKKKQMWDTVYHLALANETKEHQRKLPC